MKPGEKCADWPHKFEAPEGVEYQRVIVTCTLCGQKAVRTWVTTATEQTVVDEFR